MDAALTRLQLDGQSTTGPKIIEQHYNAVAALANCVKTTLGPYGLNKLMIDETGETLVSNDGNTILQQLQVDNPIASLARDLAQEQDKEVGDGTTSVILIAAELLNACKKLMQQSVHSSVIISGFKAATKQAHKFLTQQYSFTLDSDSGAERETLLNVAKTSISSKILSDNADYFAKIALDACLAVKSHKTNTYAIDMIGIVKSVGKSIDETTLFDGFALNCTKAARDMPYVVNDAKIACIDFNLNKGKMKMGVQVVVSGSQQLEAIRKKEIEMGARAVQLIIDSGANVVFCSGIIDDDYVRMFTKAGIMAVRHVAAADLQKIASASGATRVKSLSYQLNSSELTFQPSLLGGAEKVSQERFADEECIMIKNTQGHPAASIVIRGPSVQIIQEVDRSLKDCICAVKKALESKQLVAGAGSTEAAIAVHLEELALKIKGREQYVISAFAEAMKVIPMQLAMNAGADATELVGNLMSTHRAIAKGSGDSKYTGLDLTNRTLFDAKKAGIIDPLASKLNQLKKATECVIIIAKCDNVVKNNPSKAENHHDDEFCG